MGQALEKKFFGTVPEEDSFGFYENGQLDYRKVIGVFNFRNEDVALATDLPKTSIRFDSKMPVELKERLGQWAVAISLVANHFKNINKTTQWFLVPNPMLGGVTPRDMIRLGRFNKLIKYIQSALDENKRD